MESKREINGGKIFFIFSIVISILSIYLLFRGGDIGKNIKGWDISLTSTVFVVNILNIMGALKLKKKYPKSSRYRIYGSSILLLTAIFFDIIPRIIYR